jgi:hypothetical protein
MAKRCTMSDTKESLWESTTVQNLIRYRPSGTYFGRFRVGGKLVRQSLETTNPPRIAATTICSFCGPTKRNDLSPRAKME